MGVAKSGGRRIDMTIQDSPHGFLKEDEKDFCNDESAALASFVYEYYPAGTSHMMNKHTRMSKMSLTGNAR
jgi:hypothetical protein